MQLADPETIQGLLRQLERLNAAATRAVAAFDPGRAWEADGARTAAAWPACRCNQPVATARRRVQLGRALRHMPAVEAAWLAGDIGEAHAGLLAAARTSATVACFERDEVILVGQARQLRYRHFARCLADWAEAKERVGDGACAADLFRTPAQRRADALVEMARRAGAVAAGSRLPEPLFTVFVGYETFAGRLCELADGTVVAPGSLVRWLDEAWIERVVFDGPDRVRDVGARRRIFTGASRRAVKLRDGECFHDYCDIPADDCEIDHIEPWSSGGWTVEANGRAACGFHNRERHRQTSAAVAGGNQGQPP